MRSEATRRVELLQARRLNEVPGTVDHRLQRPLSIVSLSEFCPFLSSLSKAEAHDHPCGAGLFRRPLQRRSPSWERASAQGREVCEKRVLSCGIFWNRRQLKLIFDPSRAPWVTLQDTSRLVGLIDFGQVKDVAHAWVLVSVFVW